MAEAQVVVVDNGTSLTKAGFSTDDEPRSVINTAVGKPNATALGLNKTGYIGLEAQSRRGILNFHSPIVRGTITNWDDMEQIWHFIFTNDLGIDVTEHPVLLTEAPHCSINHKERMAELMFEKFGIPSLFIAVPGLLSVFAGSRLSALMVECGEGSIHTVPVVEGYPLTYAITSSEDTSSKLAGGDVSSFLDEMLRTRGYKIPSDVKSDVVRDIKEKYCYAAIDFDAELQEALGNKRLKTSYRVPGQKTKVVLDIERFRCPEVLFQPSLFGRSSLSIQELVYNSIMKCHIDTRRVLCQNVVVSGAACLFPGFAERLQKELQLGSGLVFKVSELPNSRYAAWYGGACFASLPLFQEFAVEKQQYDEYGPVAIYRKSLSTKPRK